MFFPMFFAMLLCASFAVSAVFCAVVSRHFRFKAEKGYRSMGWTDARIAEFRASHGLRLNWFGGISEVGR